MKKMNELLGMDLKWTQPNAWKTKYELQTSAGTAAVLEFKSSWRSEAWAESGDGRWIFDQKGFWQNQVAVCDAHTGAAVASYQKDFWHGGGTIELAFGRKITARSNFWHTRFDFTSEDGNPILQYQIGGVFHTSAEVIIEPNAANLPELPWLVPFGWYLILIMHRESAAAAAT